MAKLKLDLHDIYNKGGRIEDELNRIIREAMEKAGRIALGRLVMHQRERLMALEPRDRGLLAANNTSGEAISS